MLRGGSSVLGYFFLIRGMLGLLKGRGVVIVVGVE